MNINDIIEIDNQEFIVIDEIELDDNKYYLISEVNEEEVSDEVSALLTLGSISDNANECF